MATKLEPTDWEQVLTRHVLPAKRNDVGRLALLLTAPFPAGMGMGAYEGDRDFSLLPPPFRRWMIAARFAGESWVPLFSNAATGKRLFEANAGSPRLEVAWIGCRTDGPGWFVRINRAGTPLVEFAQGGVPNSLPSLHSSVVEPGLLDGCGTGKQAFRTLCARFDIPLRVPQVRATERELLLVGASGEPVKSTLRGFVYVQGHEIADGEDAAADALAAAIDHGDVEGIRQAVERGASLTALPGTSVSPLLSALYAYGKRDRARWEACLDALLACGCPIDGTPPDDPPILSCVRDFVPGRAAREMVKYLIAHGADVNAASFQGETALYQAATNGNPELVRLLLRHGADAGVRTRECRTALEALRSMLGQSSFAFDAEELTRYREVLSLLTASPIE